MELMEACPLTGISHIVLYVSDLDTSVGWYTKVLGLQEDRREPGRYAGLRSEAGGFRLGLFTGGQPDNHGALNHVAFSVSDYHALNVWAEHLAASGIAHEGVKPFPLGHSVDLFDPDGNNIELVSED